MELSYFILQGEKKSTKKSDAFIFGVNLLKGTLPL